MGSSGLRGCPSILWRLYVDRVGPHNHVWCRAERGFYRCGIDLPATASRPQGLSSPTVAPCGFLQGRPAASRALLGDFHRNATARRCVPGVKTGVALAPPLLSPRTLVSYHAYRTTLPCFPSPNCRRVRNRFLGPTSPLFCRCIVWGGPQPPREGGASGEGTPRSIN